MDRYCRLALLAIVLFCGASYVQACENECRSEPVKFLVEKYEAVLQLQANTLSNPQSSEIANRLLPRATTQLKGLTKTIDKTIFSTFRGPCASPPGERGSNEFCGSAKSIACFAAWGHPRSVFDSVHAAVVSTVGKIYAHQSPEIRAAMIDGVRDFCPQNCHDWIAPFQHLMLVWERREHPDSYKVTPNCLDAGNGAI